MRARFRARFLRVVAVNAVTGVLGTLGCFLCAVPGLLITAVCAAAVPFVLFEELSIIDALDASIRRSWPMIWNFIALSLPFALLSGIVGSAPTLFRIVVLKQPPQPPFGLLMLGERTLFAFTTIPNILLQVVCWAATRPAPALSETNDGNAVAAVARG